MDSNDWSMNDWADYWRYIIGVNVTPVDTEKRRHTFEWKVGQDKPIPKEQHEKWKNENAFSKGMAIIVGKIWHKTGEIDLKLVFLDADNQKAIDEICRVFNVKDLNELSQICIVEQHRDQPHKAHIYFYSAHDFQKKSSDAKKFKEAIEKEKLPAIEVKGLGSHGIAYCTPSLHKNGYPYEIMGIKIPKVFGKEIEEGLFQIYKKYGLVEDEDINKIPIEKLFESGFKILAGHNRHEALLRVMDSHLAKYGQRISEEDIKSLAHKWNEEHCDPPLPEEDFERQWKDAKKFIDRQSPNKEYSLLANQHGQLSHQSVSNAMVQTVTTETNIVIVDSECLFRAYEHSSSPKVYYIDKKRGQIMSGRLNGSFILAEKSIINIAPQTMIYHKNPVFPNWPPKIEIQCHNGMNNIGPVDNASDLLKKLENDGMILNKAKAPDAVSNILAAMRERGLVESIENIPWPGYYLVSNKLVKQQPTCRGNYSKDDIKECCELLNELARNGWKNKNIFPTVLKWAILSPYAFIIKTNDDISRQGILKDRCQFLPWLLLHGQSQSGKSTLGQLVGSMWRQAKADFEKAFGSTDSVPKLGNILSKSTYPTLINESGSLSENSFGKYTNLIETIKTSVESKIARGKFISYNTYSEIPALSPLILTSNHKLIEESGFNRRFVSIHFSADEKKNDEEQKAFADLPLERLGTLGDFVSDFVTAEKLDQIPKKWEQFSKDILKSFYSHAGLPIPDWIDNFEDQ
ncbi:MAG TPA: hypothetical protein VFT71_00675, partial [Candidatus Nitrosocosmicus sp.]|nr:hypothetical protein [Candidatus Nitrosocosmicus sp.]